MAGITDPDHQETEVLRGYVWHPGDPFGELIVEGKFYLEWIV